WLRAPATNSICTRSSSLGDLSSPQRPRGASEAPVLCACAALSIAARLPCSWMLSSPSPGVRTIASDGPSRRSRVRHLNLEKQKLLGDPFCFRIQARDAFARVRILDLPGVAIVSGKRITNGMVWDDALPLLEKGQAQ